MARDRGVLLSDKTTPCSATWSPSLPPDTHGSEYLPQMSDSGQCIIYFLGAEINTASFALYTFSLSVLVQAILIISMSGAADHGTYRKKLLVIFALVGSIATMLFLTIVPKLYLLGGLLAIISNTCFGASFVLLNSFLPVLVRHHPSLVKGREEATPPSDVATASSEDILSSSAGNIDQTQLDESTPLLRPGSKASEASTANTSLELKLSTRISSNGIGIGYIGAVILQVLSILVVVVVRPPTFSLRFVLFLIGLWWFIFTIPAALWLRTRPGPPLLGSDGKPLHSWVAYMAYAWKSLGKTVMRARRLKDIAIFLAAWFLLSDGIATVSGTAVLFAKTQLDMKPAALGLINVIVMLAGVFGAFSWSYVSNYFELRASQTIIACIILFELIPLYGLLGFIPAVQRAGLGLHQPWEMYPLGAVYGLVMGGLSSYCRSFFGELIPPGYEAAFYALYAITDKGSSIFGPAIVGSITDRYGEIRPAFGFLAILIIVPLPLMLSVNVDRGKRDALALGAELDGISERSSDYGAISVQTSEPTQE
jgi:UMF1 family MFS transporter